MTLLCRNALDLCERVNTVVPNNTLRAYLRRWKERASERMAVTVLGQPAHDLLGVAEVLLGCEGLATTASHGYRVTLRYGERPGTFIREQGKAVEVSQDLFNRMLFDSPKGSASALDGEIVRDLPILKDRTLTLLTSSQAFEDIDLDREMMNSDYFVFTLSALSLLSMHERTALQKYLLPAMDGCLFALVLHSNLLTPDDLTDTRRCVGIALANTKVYYLMGPDEKRLRRDFTALSLDQSPRSGRCSPARVCLKRAETELTGYQNVLSADAETCGRALQALREKGAYLPSRQAAAIRKIREASIQSLQFQVDERMTAFNRNLCAKMQAKFGSLPDAKTSGTAIPDYLSAAWRGYLEDIGLWLEHALADAQAEMSRWVSKDFERYLSEGVGTEIAEILRNCDKLQNPFEHQKSIRDSDESQTADFRPLFNAASRNGSNRWEREDWAKFEIKSKEERIRAGVEMSGSICEESRAHLAAWFTKIDEALANKIGAIYKKKLERLQAILTEHQGCGSDHAPLRKEIDGLSHEVRIALAAMKGQ